MYVFLKHCSEIKQSIASDIIKHHFKDGKEVKEDDTDVRTREMAARCLQKFLRYRVSVLASKKQKLKLLQVIVPASLLYPLVYINHQEKRAALKEQQADFIAFWNLLLNGMSVTKYHASGKNVGTRILWLDSTGQRLRIDIAKVEKTDANNKGIFLRDLSAVRSGATTHIFRTTSAPVIEDRVGHAHSFKNSVTKTSASV